MEQFPGDNEQHAYHRPPLDLDLSGPDGNVFMVIMKAREQLDGDTLMAFHEDIRMAMQPGTGTKYEDMLAIVNSYVDVLDTSNRYPQYGPQAHITAVVDRLNTELYLLPPGIESDVTGLYPELDNPDLGADKYGQLLEAEIQRVEAEVDRAGEDTVYDWLNLRSELLACVAALRRAGIRW